MVVVYILIFILVLGLVICFHELGHYFWAKKYGILVNGFAFGMGVERIAMLKYGINNIKTLFESDTRFAKQFKD